MGRILLISLIVLAIAAAGYRIVMFLAQRQATRNIEHAACVGRNKWILRATAPNGTNGAVLHLETSDKERRCEQLVFKPDHPDYVKLDQLQAGFILTFRATREPVYRHGPPEVTGFLRILSILTSPW